MAHIITYNSIEKLKSMFSNNIVLLFFNTTSCSVGEALESKVEKLITQRFPEIDICLIDINENPLISAHFNAFVEPTILVLFDGKEFIRESRNISIQNLAERIDRPYKLFLQ